MFFEAKLRESLTVARKLVRDCKAQDPPVLLSVLLPSRDLLTIVRHNSAAGFGRRLSVPLYMPGTRTHKLNAEGKG